jgi:hypothetical protein
LMSGKTPGGEQQDLHGLGEVVGTIDHLTYSSVYGSMA